MPAANSLPVVIIGAGPVGLAAAAHLHEKGASFLLLEAGETVAASVLAWGHVRLFSPWRYCIDPSARRLLEAHHWVAPDLEAWPTGRELADRYLLPLASTPALAPSIRTGVRVTSVARSGFDKMKNGNRDDAPLLVVTETADGREGAIFARAVIDASGTYSKPNPLGSSGVPAPGERLSADRVLYRIPDIHGADRTRYAGKRTAVVGSGHSAFNTLIELTELARQIPETQIDWVVRRLDAATLYGGEAGDELPARGALGSQVRALVEAGKIRLHSGFRIAALDSGCCGGSDCCGVTLIAEDGRRIAVDEVVANTGFRPDLAMLSELRLDLHPAVESPSVLAEMIDPNFHSCGSVEPHGAVELAHPERDFYIAGMKSYGRAPTFLMLTGYEQVRSIACALTGDAEGARNVELVLPETGVCSGDGCCLPPPKLTRLTALPQRPPKPEPCCDKEAGCCP